MPLGSQPIVDPGGQAERTRLSWNRTGLAIAVNAALLVHLRTDNWWLHLPPFLLLLVAVGCFLFANLRYHQINEAVRRGSRIADITQVRALTMITVLPAAVALVTIFFLTQS